MWRIRDIHIRVEEPTSRVNSFFIRLPRHNLGKWTDTLNCLPVWALPCFSPCQAQWGPSFSSGEKRGWACCCDTTSWFWNTGKRWKYLTRHATRQHAATMSSCFPDALQSQAFCHEKLRIMLWTHLCPTVDHYLTKAPWGKKRECVLTIGGLCDIDQLVWECVDSSSQQRGSSCSFIAVDCPYIKFSSDITFHNLF